ncbi:MAG: glutathione S-transferase family protein [Dongiaceae bacterium]
MTELTIYLGNKKYSSWSLRSWLALKHTGAPFHEIVIPLKQPDTSANLRHCSPSGRVPALHDGETIVWESLAICEYLAERFPAARLWPEDQSARAFARAVSHEMHGGFANLRDNLPMDLANRWPLGNRWGKVQMDIGRIAAIWRECRERFGRAGGNGAGDFLFGGFSIADAMYAPVVTRMVTYGVPLDELCQSYVAAMMAWPAMREWASSALAEPWVISFDVNANQQNQH